MKITALPVASAVLDTDLIAIVSDPAGTPATQKATLAQFATLLEPGPPGIQGIQGVTGNTGAAGADGFGGGSTVKKTANQTFNSATPVDVSSLSFAVTAGRYYRYEFWVVVSSDTATVGVAFALTYPAVTIATARASALIAAAGTGASFDGFITASAGAVVPTAVPVINTNYLTKIEGIIVPSSSGTLQLRARTETGTTVVTVKQGSMGFLWDLGT